MTNVNEHQKTKGDKESCWTNNYIIFQGVQKEILLGLDGSELNRGSITLYDQNYNGRRPWNTLRKWDGKQLCWYPEMSDYPLRGKSQCNLCAEAVFTGVLVVVS